MQCWIYGVGLCLVITCYTCSPSLAVQSENFLSPVNGSNKQDILPLNMFSSRIYVLHENVSSRQYCPRIISHDSQNEFGILYVLAAMVRGTEDIIGCPNGNLIVYENNSPHFHLTELHFNTTQVCKHVHREKKHEGNPFDVLHNYLLHEEMMDHNEEIKEKNNLILMQAFQPDIYENENENDIILIAVKNLSTAFIYGYYQNNNIYVLLEEISTVTNIKAKFFRLCENESGFFSLHQNNIICEHNNVVYRRASSAHYTEDGTLFVIFQRPKEGDLKGNGIESVLCSFTLRNLNQVSQLSKYNEPECKEKVGNKHCSLRHESEVGGEILALIMEEGTSLAVTRKKKPTQAFVISKHGNLLQFVLERGKVSSQPMVNVSLLKHVTAKNSDISINQNQPFDEEEKNLYLFAGSKLLSYVVDLCYTFKDIYSCLSRSLRCLWCNDVCRMESKCYGYERDENPAMHLDGPLNGSLYGGTVIKLSGRFGKHGIRDLEQQVNFSIGGKKCEIISWSQTLNPIYKWSVECKTPELRQEYTGPVNLTILEESLATILETLSTRNSFAYKEPNVYSLWPVFGPKAGGTLVKLLGTNLDIGTSLTVTLSGLNCDIQKKNATHISCISTAFRSENQPDSKVIIVNIDKHSFEPSGKNSQGQPWSFEYKEDPLIRSVDRKTTFFSGGINLTIDGDHLDSVARPRVAVIVHWKNHTVELVQDCFKGKPASSRIICPTPCLCKLFGRYQPISGVRIPTELRFKMDGLTPETLFRNSSIHHKELVYFGQPTFHRLSKYQIIEDSNPHLILQGKNLNEVLMPRDIRIFMNGTELCNVTKITSTSLICYFHKHEKSMFRELLDQRLYQVTASFFGETQPLGHTLITVKGPIVEDKPESASACKVIHDSITAAITMIVIAFLV